jgi:hypothetical protein
VEISLVQQHGPSSQSPDFYGGHSTPCRCGAHRQHRILRFWWENPSASRKAAARALKLSESNVREAFFRLRKRSGLERLCPCCFNTSVVDGVCHVCGFERDDPVLPVELRTDSQRASVDVGTNFLHAGNLLGSRADYYAKLGFVKHGAHLRYRIERAIEDPLIRGVKSDVMNELKRFYPPEPITDEAGRLCVKEVLEFRARYPGLAKSKNVRGQLAENVIARLQFLHPQLRAVRTLAPEGAA